MCDVIEKLSVNLVHVFSARNKITATPVVSRQPPNNRKWQRLCFLVRSDIIALFKYFQIYIFYAVITSRQIELSVLCQSGIISRQTAKLSSKLQDSKDFNPLREMEGINPSIF